MKEAYAVLFVLVVGWANLGYHLFDARDQWVVAYSGMGFAFALCCWFLRGPRRSLMWMVCTWGIMEGLQTGVCQLISVWVVVGHPKGACVSLTGMDFTSVEILLFAVITWFAANLVTRKPEA